MPIYSPAALTVMRTAVAILKLFLGSRALNPARFAQYVVCPSPADLRL